jgi:tetratricopeptide (TPR) repeat protein
LLRERELMMADFERAEQTAISETSKSVYSLLKREAVSWADWSDARAGALLDFTYLLDKNPNDHDALMLRGFYFFDVGAYTVALKDVSRSIEIDPSDTTKYILRALLHGKLKAYEASLADYNVAIERAPDNAGLRVHRSILLAILDQPGPAIADMNKYLKKEPVPAPMRALCLIMRAMNHDALGDVPMFMADYKAALALYPDVEIPEITRARFEQAKEAQLKLASEPIQRRAGAAALDPGGLKAKYTESIFAGRLAQLIEDCTAYIQLRPDEVDCYRFRGQALVTLGRFEQALADYRRVEVIGPSDLATQLMTRIDIEKLEDAMAGWGLEK